MYGERLETSNVSINNGIVKYPSGKSIFATNLTLKPFSATVANADIGSLVHYLKFGPHAGEI